MDQPTAENYLWPFIFATWWIFTNGPCTSSQMASKLAPLGGRGVSSLSYENVDRGWLVSRLYRLSIHGAHTFLFAVYLFVSHDSSSSPCRLQCHKQKRFVLSGIEEEIELLILSSCLWQVEFRCCSFYHCQLITQLSHLRLQKLHHITTWGNMELTAWRNEPPGKRHFHSLWWSSFLSLCVP